MGPWGIAESAVEGVAKSIKFAGREYDPNAALYYNRARYYDPNTGRFTRTDPIGLAGGTNLYEYASGDPINKSDPSGLCTKWLHPIECRHRAPSVTERVMIVDAINRINDGEVCGGFADWLEEALKDGDIEVYDSDDPWYGMSHLTTIDVSTYGMAEGVDELANTLVHEAGHHLFWMGEANARRLAETCTK